MNWGWTVGGGMEYAFDQNWIIGAEYLYVNLGSQDFSLGQNLGAANPINAHSSLDMAFSVVRAKVDFKF